MTDLNTQLEDLERRFAQSVSDARDERELDAARVAYLGRSGEVTTIRRGIGQLPATERPEAGKVINAAVERMEAELSKAATHIENRVFDEELKQEVDITFPSIAPALGTIHPVRRVLRDACAYFERHGFAVVLGPEIESDYYNFDALNIPP